MPEPARLNHHSDKAATRARFPYTVGFVIPPDGFSIILTFLDEQGWENKREYFWLGTSQIHFADPVHAVLLRLTFECYDVAHPNC